MVACSAPARNAIPPVPFPCAVGYNRRCFPSAPRAPCSRCGQPPSCPDSGRRAMKWEGREESDNVEDRRGLGRKTGLAVGGGGLVILILALLFGVDPQQIAQLVGQN